MLLIYVGSRIYNINPPGDDNALELAQAGGHEAFVHHEKKLKTEQPKVAPWYCAVLLIILIAIVAVTAEWVCILFTCQNLYLYYCSSFIVSKNPENIRTSRKSRSSSFRLWCLGTDSSSRWFGLILLPLITFSGDGIVTFSYVFKRTFYHHGEPPEALADAKPIDLSIQFILFWTPLLVLIGWWTDKPLPLLFGT
jgi:Ca2+:H+ antiporter